MQFLKSEQMVLRCFEMQRKGGGIFSSFLHHHDGFQDNLDGQWLKHPTLPSIYRKKLTTWPTCFSTLALCVLLSSLFWTYDTSWFMMISDGRGKPFGSKRGPVRRFHISVKDFHLCQILGHLTASGTNKSCPVTNWDKCQLRIFWAHLGV